jgi:hypothetical protein
MAATGPLSSEDMAKIHAELTKAGIGEGSPGVAKLTEAFAKQAPVQSSHVVCSSGHYCIIVKKD